MLQTPSGTRAPKKPLSTAICPPRIYPGTKLRSAAVVSLAWVLGCGFFASKQAATDAGVATSAASATVASPSLADKALSFLSGGPFEGDITMTVTHDGKPPIVSVFEIKGEKLRMNPPPSLRGERTYVITDYGAQKAASVSDTRKSAMLMDWNEIVGAAVAASQKPTAPPVPTGKTDIVAGYSCDVYQVTEANGDKGEACIAKGIRFPQAPGMSTAWLTALGGGALFPMRSVISDPSGKEKSRMEVTKIDRKTLDDALFVIPSDYKTVSMDDMIKHMGNHPGATQP